MTQQRYRIGIDLGGTSVRVGLFDQALELLGRRTLVTRTLDGPDAVVGDMAEAVKGLLEEHDPSDGIAIGIGSPGPLNLVTGTLMLLPNFPGWEGYPLRARLSAVTGMDVTLDCDANAAALAEWKQGAGRLSEAKSMAMLTLGTGVGSGIILEGKVWHGIAGMAGEVGHISVNPDGPLCRCGGRGCLELYASARGVVRLSEEAASATGTSEHFRSLTKQTGMYSASQIAELAAAGDKAAQDVFRLLGKYLGLGLAGLANTLDLPLIVIGGGVAAAWQLFAPAMFATLREYSFVYRLAAPKQTELMEPGSTYICPAVLGEAAGLLGAALLPSQSMTLSH